MSPPSPLADPPGLPGLAELALDLRWTWSEANDRIWGRLDPETWERTKNPYLILQTVTAARLREAAGDPRLQQDLRGWVKERRRHLTEPAWFQRTHGRAGLKGVAYFSMEFGLSESLPIYSGGLGILAGDHLKTASDLGVPLVGVGLLYQQGYFRQILAADGWQLEAFPYNDPTSLPVRPVADPHGGWLRVPVALPGRTVMLRVWQAVVGRVTLYLLDSNDPLNSPWDRGITATLYASGPERRLIQEIVLGFGGWRALEYLGLPIDVCHLNEGHAAFVVLARARAFMQKEHVTFWEALWATRVGNVFTTHTPVAAGFDRFEPGLVRQYAEQYAQMVSISLDDVLALGRQNPNDPNEMLNMAFLALRGCGCANGVSRLHGQVSRGIFQGLYPRWPRAQVPVGSITNGVHVPSWDSPAAQSLWARACGAQRWFEVDNAPCREIAELDAATIWDFRQTQRRALVEYVRRRLVRQALEHAAGPEAVLRAGTVLDPNVLTLGFARRFTAYKRPNLLLREPQRLARLLGDAQRPMQIIVAGKAHPNDEEGKRLVQEWARFAARPEVAGRVVFLEDYDMALAQQLAGGVDVWLNTPRRPWEACGTSGMKMLANGGLNLSELDGWWAEAYSPEVGWALGDGREAGDAAYDAAEAQQLYRLLEEEIGPEFYRRGADARPHGWIARVRASLARLTPPFAANRMVGQYVEEAYLPAAAAYHRRADRGAKLAHELLEWSQRIAAHWGEVRFGAVRMASRDECWRFEVEVSLGSLPAGDVQVELYAEPAPGESRVAVMQRQKSRAGAATRYAATVPADLPAEHYTPRVVPHHPDARVPLEDTHILWAR